MPVETLQNKSLNLDIVLACFCSLANDDTICERVLADPTWSQNQHAMLFVSALLMLTYCHIAFH